jgi:hypothetical protein
MAISIRELKSHKRKIELDLDKIQRQYEKAKTNHVLHLILSICSIGFWLIVWLLVASSNNSKRRALEKLMDESKIALSQIEESIDNLHET